MDFAQIVEATPKYFDMIHDLLSSLSMRGAGQRLGVLLKDVKFLEMFSKWLETWDEESMDNLRCIVTSLKLIWPKDFKALSLLNRLAQTDNEDPLDDLQMKDFHSAAVELEAKIQQTKGQVECWTQILMRSSIQYNKSSTYSSDFQYFLNLLGINVNEFFKYKAAEIVPLKKPIDIFKAKIQFLRSLEGVDCMAYYGEKMLPFLNLIGDFAKSATCLTCLYWAKESNEDIATEMINMWQKLVPFSSDITTLFIDFLKTSYDLHSPDSILVGEAVERCVDFFFDHLTVILKDDFLILRDRLIFLFTFLATDPVRIFVVN